MPFLPLHTMFDIFFSVRLTLKWGKNLKTEVSPLTNPVWISIDQNLSRHQTKIWLSISSWRTAPAPLSVTEGVREGVNNGWMKRERWCTSDELTCLQATQLLLVLQESERWQVLFFVLFLSLTCYNCLCRDISGFRMAAEASFSLLFSDAILRRWKCTSLMQQRRHKQRDWRSELFKCCSKYSVCVLARQRLITVTWCFRHYCIYHNNL